MDMVSLMYGPQERSWQTKANCMGVDPDRSSRRGAPTARPKRSAGDASSRRPPGVRPGQWGRSSVSGGLSDANSGGSRRQRAMQRRAIGAPPERTPHGRGPRQAVSPSATRRPRRGLDGPDAPRPSSGHRRASGHLARAWAGTSSTSSARSTEQPTTPRRDGIVELGDRDRFRVHQRSKPTWAPADARAQAPHTRARVAGGQAGPLTGRDSALPSGCHRRPSSAIHTSGHQEVGRPRLRPPGRMGLGPCPVSGTVIGTHSSADIGQERSGVVEKAGQLRLGSGPLANRSLGLFEHVGVGGEQTPAPRPTRRITLEGVRECPTGNAGIWRRRSWGGPRHGHPGRCGPPRRRRRRVPEASTPVLEGLAEGQDERRRSGRSGHRARPGHPRRVPPRVISAPVPPPTSMTHWPAIRPWPLLFRLAAVARQRRCGRPGDGAASAAARGGLAAHTPWSTVPSRKPGRPPRPGIQRRCVGRPVRHAVAGKKMVETISTRTRIGQAST